MRDAEVTGAAMQNTTCARYLFCETKPRWYSMEKTVANAIDGLVGLGIIIVVAVGAVLLLLRLSDGNRATDDTWRIGYPPDIFPAQALTRSGPLATLAATQMRLISIYRQMPAQSDLTIWLGAFLQELRAIMDTAYRVAVVTQVYGQTAHLDRLVAEVQQIEAQVAEHVTRQLLVREADRYREPLDGRLATLRLCVRELADFT